MSLATPTTVEKLRMAPHAKAKEEVEQASTNWRQRRAVYGRRRLTNAMPERVGHPRDCVGNARPSVSEGMILEREPDAGNPHVRFDERRLETERV